MRLDILFILYDERGKAGYEMTLLCFFSLSENEEVLQKVARCDMKNNALYEEVGAEKMIVAGLLPRGVDFWRETWIEHSLVIISNVTL